MCTDKHKSTADTKTWVCAHMFPDVRHQSTGRCLAPTPRFRLRKHCFLLVLEPHIMSSLSCWLMGALEAGGGHCRLWAGPSGEGEVGGGGGGWWGEESSLNSCGQRESCGQDSHTGAFSSAQASAVASNLVFSYKGPQFFALSSSFSSVVEVTGFRNAPPDGGTIVLERHITWRFEPGFIHLHHLLGVLSMESSFSILGMGCLCWLCCRDSPSGAERFQLHPSWRPGSDSSQGEPSSQHPPTNACLHRFSRCAAPPCPGFATNTERRCSLSRTFPRVTGARPRCCWLTW